MRLISLAFLSCLASAVPVLATGSCGYERCFGALAVGESGAIGRAAGERTLPDAERVARGSCGAACEVELFWNACGAVAMARDGQWRFGWDPDLARANDKALAACDAAFPGAGCHVRDWVCSK